MDIMQREDRYPYPLLPESGPIMEVDFSGTVQGRGSDCMNIIYLKMFDRAVVIIIQANQTSKLVIGSLGLHMEGQ
jgi:hypothetical protein